MLRTPENIFTSGHLGRSSIWAHELAAEPTLIRPLPPLLASIRQFALDEDWGPLVVRETETEWGQIQLEFLVETVKLADRQGIPILDVTHQPAVSVAENLEALNLARNNIDEVFGPETVVNMLKTATVSFTRPDGVHHHFLVSGFGDFRVEKPLEKALAGLVGVGTQSRYVNNQNVFDSDLELNMVPGLVKPVVAPHYLSHLDGICYLPLIEPSAVGMMTATLVDSLLTQVGVFEQALGWYWQEFCAERGFPLKQLELEVMGKIAIVFLTGREIPT